MGDSFTVGFFISEEFSYDKLAIESLSFLREELFLSSWWIEEGLLLRLKWLRLEGFKLMLVGLRI